jgi:hypothetical protein
MASSHTPPLVYIILVTWNHIQDTLDCLGSLFAMTYVNFRVLVVDNASTDGTPAIIREHYPQVECLQNEANRGFAVAVNQGMRFALDHTAEYVFLLNNDTVVAADVLDHLTASAIVEQVGLVVPKIYYFAQPQVIWAVGAERNPWTFEQERNYRGQVDDGRWETVRETEYVTACAVLVSPEALRQVGVLDERFYFYYEDLDWCLRMQAAGYKILLAPQAKVWHKVSRSSGGRDSPRERYWMARSSILFFSKHVRGWRWLLVIPYRSASAVRTTLRLLSQGRRDALRAYWRGLYDGWRISAGRSRAANSALRAPDDV